MPQTSSLKRSYCLRQGIKKDTTFNRITLNSSIHERLLICGTTKNTVNFPATFYSLFAPIFSFRFQSPMLKQSYNIHLFRELFNYEISIAFSNGVGQ